MTKADDTVMESKEETIAIGKAHAQVVKTKWALKELGVNVNSVSKLANVNAGEFAKLISALSVSQAVALREYFKALLALGVQLDGGEVMLTSVTEDSMKFSQKDSGLVSYLHAMIDVVVSMKTLEANLEKRNNAKFEEGLRTFRQIEAQFEQHAEKMAGQIVA